MKVHDPPLLFDLLNDPGERYLLTNKTAEHAAVIEELTKVWIQCVCVCVCLCVCECVCVCVTMNKSTRRMASTTSDTGDTSSKQQQAQRKKITTRERGPFHQSITAIPTEEKREEKQFTKPTHVAVYLFRDLDRDRSIRQEYRL